MPARLKLSNTERDRICWLVEFHRSLSDAPYLQEAKLKRMLSMPGIDELLTLHHADALATFGEAPHVDFCRDYIRYQPTGPINPAPLITGDDLVRHGLRPGRHFATILERIRDAQLDRLINDKREALAWLDEHLATLHAENS